MDKKAIVDWAEENLDGHSIHSTEILKQLEPLGIKWEPIVHPGGRISLRLMADSIVTGVAVISWQQEIEMLKARGLGLIICDKTAEPGSVRYFSTKNNELKQDAQGNLAKSAKPAYAIIGFDRPPVAYFGSWIVKDESSEETGFINDLQLAHSLHVLLGANDSSSRKMTGRGFQMRAMIEEMRKVC